MKKTRTKSIFLVALVTLVTLAGQSVVGQYVCQINGAPIVQSGSITAADPTQNTRVFRDGIPSSCTGGAPTTAAVAGTYRYDAYNYTNPTGEAACVTVDFDFTGCVANSTQLNAYSTFNPAAAGANVIGKPGFSTIATGSLGFPIAAGGSFTLVVHEVVANSGCASYNFTVRYRTGCRQAGYDRTNDGKADPTVFRPSNGSWNTVNSAGGSESKVFGLTGDIVTAGDYTGDGQTDVSTYRPSANTWFYGLTQANPGSNVQYIPFGIAGDIPVPGDYDKDGRTDVALWRPSNGTWYVLRSSNLTVQYYTWGISGDTPMVGDYDGDLINDFAIVRPVNGNYRWFAVLSNFNYGFSLGCPSTTPFCGNTPVFGLTTDRPVSGDFDADGRTDIAVYRPSEGNWYFRRSSTITATGGLGTFAAYNFGLAGDIPQPADYDGDRRTDFGVYRPSEGRWYVSNSNNGAYDTFSFYNLGLSNDQPATSPYLITNP